MQGFADQVAFVSGGASGIGLALVEALIAQGARVAIGDIDVGRARDIAERLGDRCMAVALDVADRTSWAQARSDVEARFGGVDLLCNCAGIGGDGHPLVSVSPLSFDRVIAINLTGVYNGIAAFVGPMASRGRGHVVNIASMAGLLPTPSLGAYAASKFAVVGLSETLREEVAGSGVGVTVVCPGRVLTRIDETTRAAGSDRAPVATIAALRALEPSAVAKMTLAAVLANEPLVVTHAEFRPQTEARSRLLLEAFDRADARDRA